MQSHHTLIYEISQFNTNRTLSVRLIFPLANGRSESTHLNDAKFRSFSHSAKISEEYQSLGRSPLSFPLLLFRHSLARLANVFAVSPPPPPSICIHRAPSLAQFLSPSLRHIQKLCATGRQERHRSRPRSVTKTRWEKKTGSGVSEGEKKKRASD